jgi:ectoine hydroxylase-related dioxygenase (phytanoyl-CoA dioxygenase family)
MTVTDHPTPGAPPFPQVDFVAFHDGPVQALAAGHADRLADSTRRLEPLAITVDGASVTYRPDPSGAVTVEGGVADDAATAVRVGVRDWSDWLHEIHSNMGLVYGSMVEFDRGGFDQFALWEPALRAVWSGRPARVPAPESNLGSGPFTLADDDADLARSLDENGFLHLTGVFSRAEIEAFRAEADRLAAEARPDDGRSWWATTGDGDDVLCRLIYNEERSPVIASLVGDERLERLAALGEEPVRHAHDRLDGLSIVIKPPGVVQGLADLPFHRDCGMGGHPIMCPAINIGIQLDAATLDSGCLRFVPGSHRSSQPPPRDDAPEIVTVETEPGDVTVHYGHALHQAPPPSGDGGRRALYAFFVKEEAFARIPAGKGYNDVLFDQAGDGRITNLADET